MFKSIVLPALCYLAVLTGCYYFNAPNEAYAVIGAIIIVDVIATINRNKVIKFINNKFKK